MTDIAVPGLELSNLKPDIVWHAEFIAMVEHNAVSVVGGRDGRSVGILQPDALGQTV